ncbi:MAG: hypothetical protein AABZ30_14545 [Myxococcota bacterium]
MNSRSNAIGVALALAALAAGCGGAGATTGTDSDGGPPADAAPPPAPTYRAIAGLSMGGLAAARLGLKYEEAFDVIAPLGTFLDATGFRRCFAEAMFGGFCVPPELGRMCADPAVGEDYEHMDLGGANSGTEHRTSFVKVAQDAVAIAGNFFLYNADDPYLPPGVPADWLARGSESRCAAPAVVPGLFDARFNPDGAYDAITFCDGDGPEPGVFDPDGPHDFPTDILLAIDLDGDGRRGSGEPIVIQYGEPFHDTGASAGDTFDPLDSPSGTAGNGRRDAGEPFDDVGLDGVAGTGDYGEANDTYDENPRAANLGALDPLAALEWAADLNRLHVYIDVGIRDHIRNLETTERFAGTLRARGEEVSIVDGFGALGAGDGADYRPFEVDWAQLAPNALVKYGDPDASAEAIALGDGGHIGTLDQLVQRFLTMIAFVSAHLPDGDFQPMGDSGQVVAASFYSPVLDETRAYSIFLPPGYATSDRRYPVLYLIGGHGMAPEDLAAPVALFVGAPMRRGDVQKLIVVFPDARCHRGECVEAAAHANMLGRDGDGPRFEDSFIEDLMPHIDATYRTRGPSARDRASRAN